VVGVSSEALEEIGKTGMSAALTGAGPATATGAGGKLPTAVSVGGGSLNVLGNSCSGTMARVSGLAGSAAGGVGEDVSLPQIPVMCAPGRSGVGIPGSGAQGLEAGVAEATAPAFGLAVFGSRPVAKSAGGGAGRSASAGPVGGGKYWTGVAGRGAISMEAFVSVPAEFQGLPGGGASVAEVPGVTLAIDSDGGSTM
jgi:hypothetical protein